MDKYQKLTKPLENLKKIANFIKKKLKFETKKVENQSIITRNYAMLYCQTSKEIPWPQKLEKNQNVKNFQKIIIVLRVCSTKTYSS